MAKLKVPVAVWREDNWYVALAIHLDVASQGKTKKEALENLQEAVDLYLENEKETNLLPNSKIFASTELNHIYA